MILTEMRVRFKDYEKKIQEISFEIGRTMLRAALEECDAELSRSRDKSVYIHKGKRKTVIKTILGEVEYERGAASF